MHRLIAHEPTCVIGGTKTSVVVDSVNAGCSILTVVVFTVISVDLASGALKAQWTCTAAKAHLIVMSGSEIKR